ncbi:hypothetical protein TNCV_4001091 [Trichonephila clavipes]|nr:hypothetical protein TNCV_4001091 [Trichonephila clavipes]
MLYRGRIIGKLEEGRSVTSVAAEFGIAHSIVSRLWNNFKLHEQLSGGSVVVVHGTTPADDWYIVLQARRNRRQKRGKSLNYRQLGRPIPCLPWPKTARWWSVCMTPCTVCTFNACPSEKAFSVVPGTPELRDNEWGRVLFADEQIRF